MAHALRTVDLDFLDSAPHRFVFEATVMASKDAVFGAISADPSTWAWWPGHDEGQYETPAPHGVGSRRYMRMGDSWYRETILAWDVPTRWAYRVDESANSLINALVEEWVVEGDGDRSTVRWTFAVDPGPDFEAGISGVKTMIGDMFDEAMTNLGACLAGARA
jgi:Polyketide cyclase / dehydrase and lipid transport